MSRVVAQVGDMVSGLPGADIQRQERLEYALATLREQSSALSELREKIERSRTTWLVAGLRQSLDAAYAPPPVPEDHSVLASDGSQIELDRHRWPRCYLLNVGLVSLRYGADPTATLTSAPQLYFNDDDMVIASPRDGREQVIDGALLGLRRSLEEWRGLAGLADGLPAETPALALVDGTLALWGLEAYPDFVGEALLQDGFLKCLDGIKALAAARRLALASYISMSRATEVVNALRVAVCPHQSPDCDRDCPAVRERPCNKVAGLVDGEIFSRLLREGERSDLFYSQSQVVKRYYGEHRVNFYYIKVDGEIGRVEIPEWVAGDEELLGLSHALVLDQCRRGQGYPVALSEAHEQAVVSGADRENFWRLVAAMMADSKLDERTSAKSRSKRMRWV